MHERAARLEQIAPTLKIRGILTDDPGAAQNVLDDAIAAGHEGVVVKDAASTYAAGRRGKAWRKVKPVRTYDLVVLGAEWATTVLGAGCPTCTSAPATLTRASSSWWARRSRG